MPIYSITLVTFSFKSRNIQIFSSNYLLLFLSRSLYVCLSFLLGRHSFFLCYLTSIHQLILIYRFRCMNSGTSQWITFHFECIVLYCHGLNHSLFAIYHCRSHNSQMIRDAAYAMYYVMCVLMIAMMRSYTYVYTP